MNILIGLPGSGKSTIAKALVEQGFADEVFSSDQMREELTGDMSDLSQDRTMWPLLRGRVADAMINGRRPLVDATNLSAFYRAPFLEMAKLYGQTPVAWLINTPWDLCLIRNADRTRKVQVSVMINFEKQFASCTPDLLAEEGWEVVELDGTAPDNSTAIIARYADSGHARIVDENARTTNVRGERSERGGTSVHNQ